MNTTNQSRISRKVEVRKLTIVGMLSAISIILSLTPIGYIPINPVVNLTIMHIPVIIGGILEGPVVGATVGAVFGFTSLFRAITSPTVTNFIFINPLVSVIPRMLLGIISYYMYTWINSIFEKVISKRLKNSNKNNKKLKIIPSAMTGIIATLAHTGLVLGMAYIIYAQRYAQAYISLNPSASGLNPAYILFGIVGANAIPESILAAFIVGSVVTVIKTVKR